MDAIDFVPAVIAAVLVAMLITRYCPKHWQTWGGVAIISAAFIPAGLLVLALLSVPALLVPATFILGILVTQR